ncbi:hypothetical protein [Ornithinimicrobium pratense]|uniref:Uncharacterized protein n=1 Tax=Ornithinimicrobium pratense TaxID=2593973 RepID=A0A5J6V4Y0_9MICO|nr:hypothetical protein [Ornithinimicrobium pratense]QFG69040.1 hypothetical protein FY030_10285 [Ornithinimicrobium pratense]
MVSAMAGALVVMGVVLVVLGGELVTPELWALGLVILATVAAWGVVLMLPARRGSSGSFGPALQAMVMLRVALLEAPAILGLILAFLNNPVNLLVYALPATFSLAGILLFARPRVVLNRLSAVA